jgi:hypothetical protein
MASYPRPTNTGSTFNSSNWVAPTASSADTAFLNANYCQFPTLQGAVNTKNITTTGNIGVSSNIVMNGVAGTNYIQFPDGTQQKTATQDFSGYAFTDVSNNFSKLNTFNGNLAIGGTLGVNYIQYPDGTRQYTAPTGDDINTVYNDISNTFLSGTIQTFQGSNSTTSPTGPLQISNVSTSEYASFYVDPSPTYDLTLYTAQTGNTAGLTVRNPNYSFSVNPTVGNVATFVNPITSTYAISAQSFGVNTTGSDAYTIYSNTTPSNYGLVIANTTGGNGSLTLSNNGGTLTTITSTSTGLYIDDPLSVNGGVSCNGTLNIGNTSTTNYSQISQTGNPNVLNIYNASPYISNPTNYIAIQLNNSGGVKTDALKIYVDTVVSNIGINLQGTNGIVLNGGSITNMGSLSSGYTQANGTGNTTLATTAFVQNMFVFQTVSLISPNSNYTVNTGFNSFQSLYQVLDNGNYIVSFNQTPATGTAIIINTASTLTGPPTPSTITLNYQGGYVIPWVSSSGKNMGACAILNTNANTVSMGSCRVNSTNLLISLAYNTFLLPSTQYTLNFEFFNVGI